MKKHTRKVILKKSPWTQVVVVQTKNAWQVYTRMAPWALVCFGALIGLFLSGHLDQEVMKVLEEELADPDLNTEEEEAFFRDRYRAYANTHKFRCMVFLANLGTLVAILLFFLLMRPPYYWYEGKESYGALTAREDPLTGKYGAFDAQGNEVIPSRFDCKFSFSDGCLFTDTKLDGIPCIIDRSGQIIYRTASEEDYLHVGFHVTPEITIVNFRPAGSNENKKGGLNRAGQLIIPFKYSYLDALSDNIIACDKGWGEGMIFLDDNGQEVSNWLTMRYTLFMSGSPVKRWIAYLLVFIAVNIALQIIRRKRRKAGLMI